MHKIFKPVEVAGYKVRLVEAFLQKNGYAGVVVEFTLPGVKHRVQVAGWLKDQHTPVVEALHVMLPHRAAVDSFVKQYILEANDVLRSSK